MLRKFSLLVILMGLVAIFGAQESVGGVISNGSFEIGGLDGWDTVGPVSVQDSGFGFEPQEALQYAILESNADIESASLAEMEDLLELPTGSLDELSSEPVFQGSALSQVISVVDGDELSFSFSFATNNDIVPDDLFNDFAFFSISPAGVATSIADTFNSFEPSTSPFFALVTPHQVYKQTFSSAGDYRIGFGIVDVGDTFFASALIIDDIKLSSVPEPSSMVILGAGALIACGYRRSLVLQRMHRRGVVRKSSLNC